MKIKKEITKSTWNLNTANLTKSLLVGLFFSLTLFLFAPSHVFLTNFKEFTINYYEVLSFLIIFSTITTSIVVLTTFLLRNKKIYDIFISFIFAVGIMIWIQTNLIIWNYGTFDGELIQWNNSVNQMIIDGLIWIVVLIFSLVKSEAISKIAKKISILFLITQIIYLIFLIYQAPKAESFKKYKINEGNKFTYSQKNNVIVLLLDSIQTDIFNDVLNEKEEYREIFDGFTYFPDTMSGYPITFVSVPLIITGNYYRNAVPVNDFVENNYKSNSVFKSFKENGYRTEFYLSILPEFASYYLDPQIQDNVVPKNKISFSLGEYKEVFHLLDVSFFRVAPSVIKAYIYNDQKWQLSRIDLGKVNIKDRHDGTTYGLRTLEFIDDIKGAKISKEGPFFKYYHLPGSHYPFELTEDLKIKNLGTDVKAYKEQVKANITLLKIFLKKLKDLGVYDNSYIAIISDHGAGMERRDILTSSIANNTRNNIIEPKKLKRSLALMLIKPFKSKGELKVSRNQVSLQDLPKTLLDNLKIENDFPGIDIMEEYEHERTRYYYFYNWVETAKEKGYLPFLEEYRVIGNSWLQSSWKNTTVKYFREGKKVKYDNWYDLGKEIRFGINGNSFDYQRGGWSNPEEGYTWTESKISTLSFQGEFNKDLTLVAKINRSFLEQQVLIYANENYVGEWLVNKSGNYEIDIPKRFINDKTLYISFHLPKANMSYKDIDSNNPDIRKLGILLENVILK